MNIIKSLLPNQVFVFASNAGGFHGAGSAGMAMRGESRNNWRDDERFLRAKDAPPGSNDRIGKWAVFGQAKGFQIGLEGRSYAIITISRAGVRRSWPLREIEDQLVTLMEFAQKHQELEFLMTPIGTGYSGYTVREMDECLKRAIQRHGSVPKNLIIPPDLYSQFVPSELT